MMQPVLSCDYSTRKVSGVGKDPGFGIDSASE